MPVSPAALVALPLQMRARIVRREGPVLVVAGRISRRGKPRAADQIRRRVRNRQGHEQTRGRLPSGLADLSQGRGADRGRPGRPAQTGPLQR